MLWFLLLGVQYRGFKGRGRGSGSDNNHTNSKVGVLMLNIGFPGKVLKVGG